MWRLGPSSGCGRYWQCPLSWHRMLQQSALDMHWASAGEQFPASSPEPEPFASFVAASPRPSSPASTASPMSARSDGEKQLATQHAAPKTRMERIMECT
jgi:hypothetical protein